MEILKDLTGNELKMMMILLFKCDGSHQYRGMETLSKFGPSYPTIAKAIDGLKKKGVLRRFSAGDGMEVILELKTPYDQLSDHLKEFKAQLKLDLETDEKEEGKFVPKTGNVAALIYHFAIADGVPQLKIKEWNSMNFAKNIPAATNILEYCHDDLEMAKEAVTKAKEMSQKNRISWSLAGFVVNNIHKLIQTEKLAGGGKKWH